LTSNLAIFGGAQVRTEPFPRWPMLGDEELAAAERVIRRHNLCSALGEEVGLFEQEFAAYCGVRFAVGVSNGTTALHTAIAAAGVQVGDEVIVPPYTYYSTGTSVLMQSAIPVFADVEPETQSLDPHAVEAKITPRTKAVIVVHMNGYMGDIDGLLAVARKHNLVVIEDCSHAHGAEYHGTKAGAVGHVAAFSFQQKKILSLGEGGGVTTNDPELAGRARGHSHLGKVPLAFNYRMPELHGAIGRVRLRHVDAQNDERARNAAVLDRELTPVRGLQPQRSRPATKTVYYNYVLRVDERELGVSRNQIMDAVRAEGIPATVMQNGYYPIYRHHTFQIRDPYGHGHPFTSNFYTARPDEQPSYAEGICPISERLCDHENVELKVHPPSTPSDMADIAAAFKKVVEHVDELRERRNGETRQPRVPEAARAAASAP